MGQVVLLVVGAAWAAVLIPPLLRSRGQNRPNSSVSDFRDQLTSLQKVSKSVQMRSMGRSLVAASAERPARSDFTGRHTAITLHPTSGESSDGGRPVAPAATRSSEARRHHGRDRVSSRRDEAARGERMHRQLAVDRRDSRAAVKRRRANVLFLLVLATFCTLVLAISTSSPVMLYVFAGVFVALAGYIYLLGQARLREDEEGGAPPPRQMVDVTPPRSAPSRRRSMPAPQMRQVRQHRQHRLDLA